MSSPSPSVPALDWSGAKVEEGTLTVPLTGQPDEGWVAHFESTVRLLHQGDWKVKLKKHSIQLGRVEPGAEDRVRHFLESVVLEANGTLADATGDDHDDDGPSGPDAEMTAGFRAFAPGDDDASAADA
jgi:hypothetical protein